MTDDWGISCKIVLRWMPLDLTDDNSTFVQVMAWCRQATSHYLSQCWPRFMSPYGVTRPQWVKLLSYYLNWCYHETEGPCNTEYPSKNVWNSNLMKYHLLITSFSAVQSFKNWLGPFFSNMDWLQSLHGSVITYPVKCGMKLLIHSPTSMAIQLKFENV